MNIKKLIYVNAYIYHCVNIRCMISLLKLSQNYIFCSLSSYSLMGTFQRFEAHLWDFEGLKMPYMDFKA